MLPKQRRLTKKRDFKAVFAGGKTYAHRLFILKVLPVGREQPGRFAFTTSAKIGKAVTRNRARRMLREAVRLLAGRIRPSGYDAVLIARPSLRDARMTDLSRAVEDLLDRAGLLGIREREEEKHKDE